MKYKNLLVTALRSVPVLQSWLEVLELKNSKALNGNCVGGLAAAKGVRGAKQ